MTPIITHRTGADTVTAYRDFPASPATAFASIYALAAEDGVTRLAAACATTALFDALASFYARRAMGEFR